MICAYRTQSLKLKQMLKCNNYFFGLNFVFTGETSNNSETLTSDVSLANDPMIMDNIDCIQDTPILDLSDAELIVIDDKSKDG